MRVILAVLLLATPAAAGEYLAGISIAVAQTADAAPAPKPSNTCQNCGGTGKLGDGTVFVDCPECEGGVVRAKPAPKPQPVARPLHYPSHSASGRAWLQDGHAVTASHLTGTHGFDAAFVAKLTQAQRDALHADAHEGRVRSQAVYRSDCPNGRCPTVSRSVTTSRKFTGGIFRRR